MLDRDVEVVVFPQSLLPVEISTFWVCLGGAPDPVSGTWVCTGTSLDTETPAWGDVGDATPAGPPQCRRLYELVAQFVRDQCPAGVSLVQVSWPEPATWDEVQAWAREKRWWDVLPTLSALSRLAARLDEDQWATWWDCWFSGSSMDPWEFGEALANAGV